MAPPRIDYEQELKIVRRFLRRNNIDDLMLALSTWGFDCHRVQAVGYDGSVPKDGSGTYTVDLAVSDDPDGFHDESNPSRLTVPEGLGGKYYVHAEVRWLKWDSQTEWDLADRDAGMFYSNLRINGMGGLIESSRATSSAVPFATGTTQHCTGEIDLNSGDYVELYVYQNVVDQAQVNAWLTLRKVG
jgi:hypothetical protein